MTPPERAYEFGRDELGPVMAAYLARLDQYLRHLIIDQGGKALFVARAGVRIRRLYETFLATTGRSVPPGLDYLWASRLMAVKGAWETGFERGITVLAREFAHLTIGDAVRGLFKAQGLPAGIDPNDPALRQPGSGFGAFIRSKSPAAQQARIHLSEQARLFQRYMAELCGDHGVIALVDSGWQGTGQDLLADAFPTRDWWGLYFGRIGGPASDRRLWEQKIGLVFESDTFDPARPETATVLHRHLIEGLLEPKAHSVEYLAVDERGRVYAPQAAALLADEPDLQEDALFLGVEAYLRGLTDWSPAALAGEAGRAWKAVSRTILFPSADEVAALVGSPRSADFGRSLIVPVVFAPKPRKAGDNAEQRIAEALWPQGQIAVEYPAEVAAARQRQALRDAAPAPVLPIVAGSSAEEPSVAVITRTMERPWFLRRAIESVAAQTFEDYIHVIVCDGAPIEPVRQVIEAAGVDIRRIKLIDTVDNRGMEAASNIGIAASRSRYIAIHDDDDSWEPHFLERAVGTLESTAGQRYGGVVTDTWYVSEEVTPEGVRIVSRTPYNDWLTHVQMMELAINNVFAPISFLYRRDVFDAIGPYDERFPVLGDWDFNLRFVAKSDIFVLKEPLANYHHRDVGNRGLYANSVTGERSKHSEFNAILRNKYVREGENNIEGGAGPLVALGAVLYDLRNTVRETLEAVSSGTGKDRDRLDWSKLADERWIMLNLLARRHATELKTLSDRAREAIAGDGDGLRGRLEQAEAENDWLRQELADMSKRADDYWIALAGLLRGGSAGQGSAG